MIITGPGILPVQDASVAKAHILRSLIFDFFDNFFLQILVSFKKLLSLHSQSEGIALKKYAEVAQLVEHNLAKVGVARSNRVFCSERFQASGLEFFLPVLTGALPWW